MIKIVSAAQHTMLTKAASDAAYARQRGIDQDMARDAIEAHAAAGKPKLPDRVVSTTFGGARSQGKTAARSGQPKDVRPLFLSSTRA